MNPIWNVLSGLVTPVTTLIDKMHTSDEEKLKIQAEMFKLQTEITGRVMDYEKQLLEAQSSIINSEAKGDGWLQRNWRPLMMVWFAVLLGLYWFGYTPPNMSEEVIKSLFSLLELGIGGYVIGRSAEKIIPQVVATMKGK